MASPWPPIKYLVKTLSFARDLDPKEAMGSQKVQSLRRKDQTPPSGPASNRAP